MYGRFILEYPYSLVIGHKDWEYHSNYIFSYNYVEKLVIVKTEPSKIDGTYYINVYHKGWIIASLTDVVKVEKMHLDHETEKTIYEPVEWEYFASIEEAREEGGKPSGI